MPFSFFFYGSAIKGKVKRSARAVAEAFVIIFRFVFKLIGFNYGRRWITRGQVFASFILGRPQLGYSDEGCKDPLMGYCLVARFFGGRREFKEGSLQSGKSSGERFGLL